MRTIGLLAVGFFFALSPSIAIADGGASADAAHRFGFWSLAPPLVAIVLAIFFRRIIPALVIGVFIGALLLEDWNPLVAVATTCESFLWPALSDADHLRVFTFTLMMAAMVGVIHRSGGMHALVNWISPLASNRRRGQLTTWALGLIVFFDDYANTLLLGGTMRSVTDRLRISREKLAYLVDSTAAPVAGLAIVSTWVATEVTYIADGYQGVGLGPKEFNAFAIFLQTIPYRFYQVLALVFVALVAVMLRDFGPMLTAEREALRGEKAAGNAAHQPQEDPALTPSSDHRGRAYHAVLPIMLVLTVCGALIVYTGRANLEWQPATLWQIVGSGDSYLALMYAALAGLITAGCLAWVSGVSLWSINQSAIAGGKIVMPAMAVLWLAWALQDVTSKSNGLDTGEYLASLLHDNLAAWWLPTVVFVLASGVAFATGTSWGTMGILTPLAIRVTYALLDSPPPDDPLMLATIGGVLAGAIFGDHCSPISDTTVLSSAASGCNHLAHVWTQMPYALTVGGVSILCGTLPAGLGLGLTGCLACLAIATVVLTVVLFLFGRRSEP